MNAMIAQGMMRMDIVVSWLVVVWLVFENVGVFYVLRSEELYVRKDCNKLICWKGDCAYRRGDDVHGSSLVGTYIIPIRPRSYMRWISCFSICMASRLAALIFAIIAATAL